MQIRCRVGAEMARARKEKRMTQAELAARVNASQRMIAAIEGDERRPSPELAQKIGAELGFPWTVFFDQANWDWKEMYPKKQVEESDNVVAFESN